MKPYARDLAGAKSLLGILRRLSKHQVRLHEVLGGDPNAEVNPIFALISHEREIKDPPSTPAVREDEFGVGGLRLDARPVLTVGMAMVERADFSTFECDA